MAATANQKVPTRKVIVVPANEHFPQLQSSGRDIGTVINFIQDESANPLTAPAQECVRRIATCARLIGNTTSAYDRAIRGALGSIESAVESVAHTFPRVTRELNVKKHIEQAVEDIRKEIAEKYSGQEASTANAAIEAMQAYDKALTKERVRYSSPLPPAGQAFTLNPIALDKMRAVITSWSWQRVLAHYLDLSKLFESGEQEFELFELLALERLNAFERDKAHIAATTSPRDIEPMVAAVTRLQSLIEARRKARLPEWLFLHDATVYPAIQLWFKMVAGIDIRQLDALGLARLNGVERQPWDCTPEWSTRYALPKARDLIARPIVLDVMFRAPGQPAFSELLKKAGGK